MTNAIAAALVASAHFLAVFAVLAVLVMEWVLYSPRLSADRLAFLRRVDAGYLIAALAVIATGLLRIFASPEGVAFYTHNPVFWAKMGLFVAVGLLSIVPTIHYLRLPRTGEVLVDQADHRRIRRFIAAQISLFALIPIAATFMARGVGL